jgi:hypothetical protein
MELSGYQVKEEGRQGIGPPAPSVNVMVCGYSGRFVSFASVLSPSTSSS